MQTRAIAKIQDNAVISDSEWLRLLTAELQLLADLSYSDVVLWRPNRAGIKARAQARPSSSTTVFFTDIIGSEPRSDWLPQMQTALSGGESKPATGQERDGSVSRLQVVPVRRLAESNPIAVITRHTSLSDLKAPNKIQINFMECAAELLQMIAVGKFPAPENSAIERSGAPRASDGLIRLTVDGKVSFASPNALSLFKRCGIKGDLEGKLLAQQATRKVASLSTVDEGLPLVLTGKAAWRADFEAKRATLALRSVPVFHEGVRDGAILLCRDVSLLRARERELINKDLTIREIHHRVKNNLQTVASLLRIQSRQTKSPEVRESLAQAQRRVSAIALVHDVLSEGIDQEVRFDEVFERIMSVVPELASGHTTKVVTQIEGEFGRLPAERATALALVLTEIITNAVEHGLRDRSGTVRVEIERDSRKLQVAVTDDGVGLPEGKLDSGLGTQIIRTLVESELRGKISWSAPIRGGTRVLLQLPI